MRMPGYKEERGQDKKKVKHENTVTQRLHSASDKSLWSAQQAGIHHVPDGSCQRSPQDCPNCSRKQRPMPPRRSLLKTHHLPGGSTPGSCNKPRKSYNLAGLTWCHSSKCTSERGTKKPTGKAALAHEVPKTVFLIDSAQVQLLRKWRLKAWAS